MTLGRILALLAVGGCAHQSVRPGSRPPRLESPEDVIVVPFRSPWLVPAMPMRALGPPPARTADGKIDEAYVGVAFVVDDQGNIERQTISFVDERGPLEYRDVVCEILDGAIFAWHDHDPTRGLLFMSFDFGDPQRHAGPLGDLSSRAQIVAQYSPAKLAEWVETRPHCRFNERR